MTQVFLPSQVNKLYKKLKEERSNKSIIQGGIPAKMFTCGLIIVAQNQRGKLHSRLSEDIFIEKDFPVENFNIQGQEEEASESESQGLESASDTD